MHFPQVGTYYISSSTPPFLFIVLNTPSIRSREVYLIPDKEGKLTPATVIPSPTCCFLSPLSPSATLGTSLSFRHINPTAAGVNPSPGRLPQLLGGEVLLGFLRLLSLL